jgi:hypothetical protein
MSIPRKTLIDVVLDCEVKQPKNPEKFDFSLVEGECEGCEWKTTAKRRRIALGDESGEEWKMCARKIDLRTSAPTSPFSFFIFLSIIFLSSKVR